MLLSFSFDLTSKQILKEAPALALVCQHGRKMSLLMMIGRSLERVFFSCLYPPNNFLKKIGYEGALVAHGWRRVFNTTCKEELKQSQEIIKLQMGHLPDNKVDKAYDKSEMLDRRREFLENWGDLLVEKGLEL